MRLDPRPLTDHERSVLDRVLSSEFDGVLELRDQARDVQVVGRCDCGCPSVDLRANPNRPKAQATGRLAPVELQVRPRADEPPGNIILFLDDGQLSYLEYVYYTDSPPPSWPTADRLRNLT